MRRTFLLALLGVVVLSTACSDPARFRPARGAKDYPSGGEAYRVQAPKEGCEDLGFVVQAESIADIARTAGNHGGTHYQVLDDFGNTSIETDGVATRVGPATVVGHSSSYAVDHHAYTARVYRCAG